MKMKHIEAETMQEAMEFAREALGEDAVLLASEDTKSGSVIVTFAIEEMALDDEISEALGSPSLDMLFEEDGDDDDDDGHEAAPKQAANAYSQPRASMPTPRHPLFSRDHPALDILSEALQFHGLPETMHRTLHSFINTHELPDGSPLDAAETMLAAALNNELRYSAITPEDGIPERAIMLVGPYGAGKTTAIAKLATAYALKKVPVMIISTDMERLGGIAPLQGVADILNCELLVAENRTQLRNLVKSQIGKHALLIDSAGVNIYQFAELKALGELASLDDVEPVLCCPAGLDAKEAEEMASVFSFLDIARMMVTRMDTARHFSSIFHALGSSHYALANLSQNPSPASALTPFDGALLAHFLLTHHRDKMAH